MLILHTPSLYVCLMGRYGAPPLDNLAILRARLRKGLTQAEVAEQCAALNVKIDRSGLSYIESGKVRWPHPKIAPVLAEVLGLELDDMFKAEDGSDDEEEDDAAAKPAA